MSKRDQIDQAAMLLLSGAKDECIANVLKAVNQKKIDVKPEHLDALLSIVGSSIDEGFFRAFRTYGKAVDSALNSDAAPVVAVGRKSPKAQ